MLRRKFALVGMFFALVLSPVVPLFSADTNSPSEKLLDAILGELSGLRALDNIYSLCTFDRSGASQGLYDSEMWIFHKLKDYGIRDVVLDRFPADGETLYLDTHPAGYAWEKKRAILHLVEPYAKKLLDYQEIPTALIKYSNSANVTAELVDVGAGVSEEDYAGKDVAGKILFASGNSYSVYPIGITRRGALGLISYWENDEPDRSRFPDQVPWMAIPQELDTNHFGFSASQALAKELKGLLSKGKVVVHAEVEAQNKKGSYYVLSSSLPGTSQAQEIILTAHINHYKPGANDNASGSALLMEIERSIKSLLDAGKIPPLKRTIRFVWVQEHTGTKVYLDSRPDISEKGIMAINLDMVGENTLLCESSLRLVLGPHSCPSFVDDLMNQTLQLAAQLNITESRGTRIPLTYVEERYNGAVSDHFYYPSRGISVPVSFLYLWPDNFYHSNDDTPDKSDPTMLKRLGFVAAFAALYVASANASEAEDLCNLVFSEGARRLLRAAKEGIDSMRGSLPKDLYTAYKEARNKVAMTGEKEFRGLESVTKLSADPAVKSLVNSCLRATKKILDAETGLMATEYRDLCHTAGLAPQQITLTDKEIQFSRVVPKKNFRGPLNFKTARGKMSEARQHWLDEAEQRIIDFFLIKDEILNFIDGRSSVLDIRNSVSAEFYALALDDIFNFLECVRDAGFVTFGDPKVNRLPAAGQTP